MRAPALPGRTPATSPRTWRAAPAALVAAVAAAFFALRLALGALQAEGGVSLHVDEAQYWDWSRTLQWGYYSKPPLIAALIGLSRGLFGDGEVALRALAMACYPLAALVLVRLGQDMAPSDPAAPAWRSPGALAALIFLASPVAALLGLVATTDGPLMLAWALALAALWTAVQGRRAAAWWAFGVACGIGLLDKYTMAALLPGAALFVLLRGAARDRRLLGGALLLALLIFAPHLLWNQAEGWPTWRHTADITLASVPRMGAPGGADGRVLAQLSQWVGFVVAQPLMLAPLVGPALWLVRAARGRSALPAPPVASAPSAPPAPSAPAVPAASAMPFLVCTHAPLVLVGLVQAATGAVQVNWILPVHLAGALVLGMAWARAAQRLAARAALLLALAVQVVALSALSVWPLAPATPGAFAARAAALDPWARQRGWRESLAELGAVAQRERPDVVIGTTRAVMAHMAYHWRGFGPPRQAWQGGARPAHHYEWTCPWNPGAAAAARVLVLSEGAPPPQLAAQLGGLDVLARASPAAQGGRVPALLLSRPTAPDAAAGAPRDTAAAPASCR